MSSKHSLLAVVRSTITISQNLLFPSSTSSFPSMSAPVPLSGRPHLVQASAAHQEEEEDVPHHVEVEEEHDDPLFVPSILLDREISPGAIRAAEEHSSEAELVDPEYDCDSTAAEEEYSERAREVNSFTSNVLFVSGPHEYVDLALIRKINEQLALQSSLDEDEDKSEPLDLADKLSFERLGIKGHCERRKDWRTELKKDAVRLEVKERKTLEGVAGCATVGRKNGEAEGRGWPLETSRDRLTHLFPFFLVFFADLEERRSWSQTS